ncbi:MAG: hypothetical protein RLZZ236_1507, partial [Bacteroidota bacterium]
FPAIVISFEQKYHFSLKFKNLRFKDLVLPIEFLIINL